MCTGDSLDTAVSIARMSGILTGVADSEDAEQFTCMTGKQFREAVGGI